jgi:multidrug efflux pump subunit AcrA (membrane-fusion protein)
MGKVFGQKVVESSNTMDVVRERRRRIPRSALIGGGAVVLIVLVAWAIVSMSHSSSVVVDRSTLVTDVAQRGTLLRSVSAQGVFAPESTRVVSATQPGVVNQIFVKEGNSVQSGSVIAQMRNPELEAKATDAQSALRVAQANLADARQQAQTAVITQKSALEDAVAQSRTDALGAQSYSELHRRGLVADLPYRQAQIQAQKSSDDLQSRRAQVAVAEADSEAKVAAALAQVDEAQAELASAQEQVDALTVRAEASGIVQTIEVQPGTSVAENTVIAHIADPRDLKGVLQLAEGDVHVVNVGMRVSVDTGNGKATGRVSRIAPSAQNGTVAVDVTFPAGLPDGARPDANIDGTVIVATIPDAVSIARPAGARDNSAIDLFKVTDNGARAVRVTVRLGQGSNNRVQVLSGLEPGDTVVVSDMSAYSNQTALSLR